MFNQKLFFHIYREILILAVYVQRAIRMPDLDEKKRDNVFFYIRLQ